MKLRRWCDGSVTLLTVLISTRCHVIKLFWQQNVMTCHSWCTDFLSWNFWNSENYIYYHYVLEKSFNYFLYVLNNAVNFSNGIWQIFCFACIIIVFGLFVLILPNVRPDILRVDCSLILKENFTLNLIGKQVCIILKIKIVFLKDTLRIHSH